MNDIDDWNKVTIIYCENQNDFSGSAIRLNEQGDDNIAIHSYNQGSILHVKTNPFEVIAIISHACARLDSNV